MSTVADTGCCPVFDPTGWDGEEFQWDEKRFIKDKVFTLFYMPMNFGTVIRRVMEKVVAAGASVPGNMGLSDHTSKWNMDLYLAVDKDVPGAEMVALSGRYFSKVYEGPYSQTGRWCKDFEGLVKEKGMAMERMYMWYTTCPKCAKTYGKNYVVIVAKMGEESEK